MDTETATIGDNKPPSPIDELRNRLEDDYGAVLARRDELLASVERMPDTVNDDAMAGKFGDQIKLISSCIKKADSHRKAEKEPHLEGGRAVDGWFKAITEPLEKAKGLAQAPLAAYERQKAAAERRRLEDEAKRQREEAERAAQDAKTDDDLDTAVATEETAQDAEVKANASNADLSRTRGDYGSVSSLRTTWKHDGLDRDRLNLEALRPHLTEDAIHQAIRSFIKAGGRNLAGVRIYEHSDVVVR